MRMGTAFVALAASVLLVDCGGRGESSGIPPGDPQAGAEQFEMHCGTCHPNGEAATGPSLSDRRFAPAHVRRWIRQGSERMSPIHEEQLSDADLRDLIAYMAALGAVEDR